MANTYLTIGMVTREALRVLENELTFTRNVNRDYDDQFGKTGFKIGNTLNVRKPVRAVNANGQALILQDLTEQSVPVIINKQYQRSFAITSSDMKLNVDDFSKRFVNPFMLSMANEIDYDGLQLFKTIANEVGTPGTIPANTSVYLAAGSLMSKEAAPLGGRKLMISPDMNATIVQNLQGLFNPQVRLSKQYTKGMITEQTVGFDWFMDQNVGLQTIGPLGGTPTVNATAGQVGSAIVTTGWTAAAVLRLKKGDVIQFAGVFGVNPQNRQSYGRLRDFVLTSDFSSDGSGNGTINISPAIVPPNADGTNTALQNVTAGPAANAAITVNGTGNANLASPRGLAFHPDAFTFATVDLPEYEGQGGKFYREMDPDTKVSMRVTQFYDGNLDRGVLRIDVLGGWATTYQELATRIAS